MMLRVTISRRRVNWKLSVIILLGSFLPGSLRAQAPPPPQPSETAQSAPQTLPPEALNQLLAPIALYPDALIALILPASTMPSDLVLAARYISANGVPAQVANQPWDESVKSLVRYPDIVKWMDQNLEWTTQVGEAFLDQPADVMNTIQQLRAQAIAAGNLVDTPQQRIVKEEDCVRIVPAEPELIYVPRYDPEVVYAQPYAPYFGPALTFGVGFAVGSWLNYDCDWPRRRVFVGDWNPRWKHDWDPGRNHNRKRNRGDGRDTINVVNINRDTARVWQPSGRVQRQQWKRQRTYNDNATAYYNLNARNRRGDVVDDPGRRLAAVARPSRLGFDAAAGNGDRRANSEASHLARSLPGEAREFRSPLPGQAEQLRRGNGTREWKGKGKGKEQSAYQANAVVNRQSSSLGEKAWQGDNSKGRKWRSNSESVKAGRSNENGERSKHSKSLRSKANDSSQQFKAGRSKSSHFRSTAPSVSKANKHSQAARIERSKGGSRHAAESYSKPNKRQSAGGIGKKSGGGGKKGSEKGGKGKGKNKD